MYVWLQLTQLAPRRHRLCDELEDEYDDYDQETDEEFDEEDRRHPKGRKGKASSSAGRMPRAQDVSEDRTFRRIMYIEHCVHTTNMCFLSFFSTHSVRR